MNRAIISYTARTISVADLPPSWDAERKEQTAAVQRDVMEHARAAAFQSEADPLFFKWQAGEGTEAEWLAKREGIRNRFPYPGSVE